MNMPRGQLFPPTLFPFPGLPCRPDPSPTRIPLQPGDLVVGMTSWRETIIAVTRCGYIYYLKRDVKDAGWSWQKFM